MASAERSERLKSLSPARRAALLKALQAGDERRQPPEAAVPRRALSEAPLSFAQQRLWFLDRLLPGSALYNVAFAARLRGPLAVGAWRDSLEGLAARHEVLRTRFPADRPVQIVEPRLCLAMPRVDLAGLPAAAGKVALARLMEAEARRPFDLERLPLMRATLVLLAPLEHCLLLTLHHIVCDGWSDELLLAETAALYGAARAGGPSPLPELPIQYADFAAWQRELPADRLAGQLAYWRERMAGAPPLLALPLDRPRPSAPSYRCAYQTFRVPAEVADGLRRLASATAATTFMTLLAAWQAVLCRYTGETDLVVGTPVANRARAETQGLIGLFVNSLPLRTRLDGDPVPREILRRVRETALGAFGHQDLPFERLVEALQPERSLSHSPLFQALFLYLAGRAGSGAAAGQRPGIGAAAQPATMVAGLAIEPMEIENGYSELDLSLSLAESADGGLHASLRYGVDLFAAATATRLARHLAALLAAFAATPERPLSTLPLLTSAERFQLLVEWNATAAPSTATPLLHLRFLAQATRSPQAAAVSCQELTLSYGQLAVKAGRIAVALGRRRLAPNSPVAVLLERGPELMPALLGILMAGHAYLPLDSEWPEERLASLLRDSGVPLVLTVTALLSRLPLAIATPVLDLSEETPSAGDDGDPGQASSLPPESLAYVIYTSGSTGAPKGSMISHGAICNRLEWMQSAYGLAAGDRVLQKTPLTFDVSVWELFWPLLTGATLVLADPGEHHDPGALARRARDQQITVLHFVPSMLQAFLEQPEIAACASLRLVVASGEALPSEMAARFHQRLRARLENLYGPTEAAVDVTSWRCLPGAPDVPIGRPIANVSIFLLGRHGEPVPIGVAGELHIGGVALARGYLGRADLTAASFVPDPACGERGRPGERLYRSGDLARFRADGAVCYLGRIDHQVKVRGVRIELGEIEAALLGHPGVHEAVAAVVGDTPGERRLVAYLTATPPMTSGEAPGPPAPALNLDELRRALLGRLPAALVPSLFVVLAALPRTGSGKVDRRRLPDPDPERAALRQRYVAPSNPVEHTLAEIWAAVLRLDRVGIEDNFFALGGDSMNSLQVVARARERGVTLTVQDVFRHQTLRELAAAAAAQASAQRAGGAPASEPDPAEAGERLLAALLSEVEGMSDETVRHRLDQRRGSLPERASHE